jgi:hypothetical protein
MLLTGENRRTPGKACPSATLFTTNPTWTALGANPGLRGEKPSTNRLNYGTTLVMIRQTAVKQFWYTVLTIMVVVIVLVVQVTMVIVVHCGGSLIMK